MTKQEYERVRQEVAKKYKDRITELEIQNQQLSEMVIEERREKGRITRELEIYKRKFNAIPEHLQGLIEMSQRLL